MQKSNCLECKRITISSSRNEPSWFPVASITPTPHVNQQENSSSVWFHFFHRAWATRLIFSLLGVCKKPWQKRSEARASPDVYQNWNREACLWASTTRVQSDSFIELQVKVDVLTQTQQAHAALKYALIDANDIFIMVYFTNGDSALLY